MSKTGFQLADGAAEQYEKFNVPTMSRPAAESFLENIDIGGPAMIRAAAKNHAYVTAITDPEDYGRVLEALRSHGGSGPLSLRRELAALAFARTAAYDAAVSGWFASMLAGAVFVEYIFGWNGLGKEVVDALNTLDLPIIMGAVLVIATTFILINILVDIIYGILDPKVRIR